MKEHIGPRASEALSKPRTMGVLRNQSGEHVADLTAWSGEKRPLLLLLILVIILILLIATAMIDDDYD